MEQFAYTLFLLVSLGGLAICDWRWKLAFFYNAGGATKVIFLGVIFFIIWDLAGIALGIFYLGQSRFTSGLEPLPGFHIEEILFLFLLCYTALIIYRGSEKAWQRT